MLGFPLFVTRHMFSNLKSSVKLTQVFITKNRFYVAVYDCTFGCTLGAYLGAC